MKKRYLALAMGIVLAGCSGDEPTFTLRPTGGTGGDTTPPSILLPTDVTIVNPAASQPNNPQRQARTVEITLPSTLVWTRYQICESATNCTTPIVEGNGSGSTLSFGVGDLTLEQMLRISTTGRQVRFYNGSGTEPVATMDITSAQATALRDAINNTIQYFKSGFSESGDDFGQTVSISQDGKTIAIGSWDSDTTASTTTNPLGTNGTIKSGAVFIFTDVPPTPAQGQTPATVGGWQQTAVIKFSATDSENAPMDFFGRTVSLSDDGRTIAIAMPGDDTAGTGVTNGTGLPTGTDVENSGAALIYTGNTDGTVWTRQAFLKARTATLNLQFAGGSLAISGDGNTLAVTPSGAGANTAELNGVTVFTRTGTDWALLGTTNIVPAGTADDGTDLIGRGQGTLAFSANGQRLAVAAPGNDSASSSDPALEGAVDSGAVYVFSRTSATAEFDAGVYIKEANRSDTGTSVANIQAGVFFGRSLDLSANGMMLAVGSGSEPAGTGNTITSSEAVYVYDLGTEANATWLPRYTATNRITPPANSTNATGFGRFIKLDDSGENLAVYTINARRAPGVTDVEATGNVIQDPAVGSGSISFYSLTGVTATTAATATRNFHLQASRPVGNENYREFGHWLALSGGGMNPLVFVGGSPNEDSDATGINMENDNLVAAQSGAAWVLRVK